jgi:malate dehydrogenase (oxaloacetate-decarboxylating)
MEMNEQLQQAAVEKTLQVFLSGFDLINSPRLNKGTAFTAPERDTFALHGLLPPHIGTLDERIERRLKTLRAQANSFSEYSFLRDLQDTDETLFYAFLVRNIGLPTLQTQRRHTSRERLAE